MANRVVIATVLAQEGVMYAHPGQSPAVMTRNTMLVMRTIEGPALGGEFDFYTEGGEVGRIGVLVGGAPRLSMDRTYLLFLLDMEEALGSRYVGVKGDDHRLSYIYHLAVPPDLVLPDEQVLRQVWEALCASNPDGITPEQLLGFPTSGLALPPGLNLNSGAGQVVVPQGGGSSAGGGPKQ
jgi:hypothetical protein